MKNLVKEILPPFLFKLIKEIKPKKKIKDIKGKEREANWYDEKYRLNSSYHDHYTKSPYYFTWAVIVEKLAKINPSSILDLGCGPGQFANLLYDKGYRKYNGIDFSKETIKIARETCPEYKFHNEDILVTNLIESIDYDLIITLEFLEHIEKDIEVLERIKSGVTIIATVPSYNSEGHVRYFSSVDEVKNRYSPIFVNEPDVTEWLLSNDNNARFFLFQGIKK